MFLLGAASILNNTSARLSLGIHAETPFYDCSVPFLNDVQRLFDGYFAKADQAERERSGPAKRRKKRPARNKPAEAQAGLF